MDKILRILMRVAFAYIFFNIIFRLAGKMFVSHGQPGGGEIMKSGEPFDFVVALIISDIPDNIIWADAPLAQGIVAASTLVFLHLLVSYISCRNVAFAHLVGMQSATVIRDGQPVRATTARERITPMDLDSMLRLENVDKPEEVEEAALEPGGGLSVRKREEAQSAQKRDYPGLERLFS